MFLYLNDEIFRFIIGNITLDLLSPKDFHFRRAHVLIGDWFPPHTCSPVSIGFQQMRPTYM